MDWNHKRALTEISEILDHYCDLVSLINDDGSLSVFHEYREVLVEAMLAHRELPAIIERLKNELAAERKRADAAEADAKRYRYIRSGPQQRIDCAFLADGNIEESVWCDEFDAAIDDAMK
jgi:hypothetical protein